MNILETEWWSVGVPPEWWAESEDDSIIIGDRDDVGAIEISTLHKESGEFDSREVAEIAAANSESDWRWAPFDAGMFSGVCCSYEEGADAVREWYLACGPLMLFVTYSCETENAGLDLAAVEEILRTLAPVA